MRQVISLEARAAQFTAMVARMNHAALWVGVAALTVGSVSSAQTSVSASPLERVLLGRRLEVGTGAYGSSYGFEGGSWGNGFSTQHVDARWLFGGLTLEAGLLHSLPVSSGGAVNSFNPHLRLGWTWSRGSVTVGAVANLAPGTPAAQYLPSVSAAYAFSGFGLSAGLFDMHGRSIARISFEQEYFGVGYVAPLGAEIHARLPVWRSIDLKVQAMAFRLYNAQVGYLSVAGVFDADKVLGGGVQ